MTSLDSLSIIKGCVTCCIENVIYHQLLIKGHLFDNVFRSS